MNLKTLALVFAVLLPVALMPACSTNPSAPHQTLNDTIGQGLDYAQVTATAANRLIVVLVDSRTITADQAEDFGAAADLVDATVKLGRQRAKAGDAAGARSQLSALAADLAALAEFLEQHRGK